MDPTACFAELIVADEPPLDEGALLIAAHAHPGLDLSVPLGLLDDLARGCPSATLEGMRQYLFEELGFRGNASDYGDPDNSYLDTVLERRLGIPITLSVVTIEVGRRAGVHLGGVGMPGHFLVRSLDDPGLFLDPFSGGRFLGVPECRELFAQIYGEDAEFRGDFLDLVGARAVLWRMLTNLRLAFTRCGDLRNLGWVVELQLMFPDLPAPEAQRLGAALGAAGRLQRAAETLEALADRLPSDDAARANRQARVLRARLN